MNPHLIGWIPIIVINEKYIMLKFNNIDFVFRVISLRTSTETFKDGYEDLSWMDDAVDGIIEACDIAPKFTLDELYDHKFNGLNLDIRKWHWSTKHLRCLSVTDELVTVVRQLEQLFFGIGPISEIVDNIPVSKNIDINANTILLSLLCSIDSTLYLAKVGTLSQVDKKISVVALESGHEPMFRLPWDMDGIHLP